MAIFIKAASQEESRLIEAFSHFDYFDSDASSNIYSYSPKGQLSYEKRIELFIAEMLNGDDYGSLQPISESKAKMLLRRMAVTKINFSGKKENFYNAAEAKLSAGILMEFMGKSAEYFTNVNDVDAPHDNPAKVISNSINFGEHDSICFFGINSKYLVYIEQAWNFRGE